MVTVTVPTVALTDPEVPVILISGATAAISKAIAWGTAFPFH
jgi:hypothetical protein